MNSNPNENEINLNSFTKELIKDDVTYNFEFKRLTNVLHFRVTKHLDLNYWENSVDYQELQKANPSLFMPEEQFIEIVYNGMMLNDFDFKMTDNTLSLEFSMEIVSGKYRNKVLIPIILTNKKGEISENMSKIATHLRKVESSYEKLQNCVDVKLSDLEANISEKSKRLFDEIMLENEKDMKKLSLNYEILLNKEKENFERLRLEVLRDSTNFRYLPLYNEINYTTKKIFPKFIDVDVNNFTALNDFRTIEMKTSGWKGQRADVLPLELGVYECSIKVEKTDTNSYIMFGVCLTSHSKASGYYNGQCLAMFYLHNGYIYLPSLGASAANGFRAVTGAVITMTIDTRSRFVYFKANGVNVAPPRFFICSDEDVSKICPCVDLHTQNNIVSFC
jgi:hypothetical protein